MRTQRGPDRRQRQIERPAGQPERRCGTDRRRLKFTEQSIAEMEARLATLSRPRKGDDDEGSGWDKLIIPVK
ncbi:MAG: hypothetical protein IAE88_07755 [Rhodobacteraceae bacterium]|uniref:hypothetical protein n=1 Tax=Accumulibacter sp. TaxID=2053492 RepID=UPI0019F3D846|nr:hypothetical protein [Accumulibacter sp.]MBE2258737.1 hypothetical protein [Paracoccaceae bacterium]MCB1942741.1 hypothetical protein [Accumulibacter sp.]